MITPIPMIKQIRATFYEHKIELEFLSLRDI